MFDLPCPLGPRCHSEYFVTQELLCNPGFTQLNSTNLREATEARPTHNRYAWQVPQRCIALSEARSSTVPRSGIRFQKSNRPFCRKWHSPLAREQARRRLVSSRQSASVPYLHSNVHTRACAKAHIYCKEVATWAI